MGQATLAFRNLLIRAAIFVVLAALLAWVVGGTLFGKHRVNFPAVTWDGHEWSAQVIGNGNRADEVHWRLLWKVGDEPWTVVPISQNSQWSEMIGPTIDEQGLMILVNNIEQPASKEKKWTQIRFTKANAAPTSTPYSGFPTRLP